MAVAALGLRSQINTWHAMQLSRKSRYLAWRFHVSSVLTSSASAPPRLAIPAPQIRPFAIPKAPSSTRSSRGVGNVLAQASSHVSNQNAPRNGLRVSSGSSSQGQNAVPTSRNLGDPRPTSSAPQQTVEHILSQGECMLIDDSDGSSVSTKFVAKVSMQRNEGLLMLMPSGQPQSVYNVLSLGVPVIQGPYCIIYGARNERLHKVKLRTVAAAESFQYLLKTLQQSARQFCEPRPASPKLAPIIAASKEEAASPLPTPSKAAPKAVSKAPEDAPETADGDKKAALQTPQSTEPPLHQDSEKSLLNLEDEAQPQPSLTIEAAADHMQRIVHQILSEITASGVNVPEKGVAEIESTAIANWMAQGFMESEAESDELKEELVDLLRLLVRIKRKVQYRHGISVGNNDVSISSETLQDLQEIVEKPSKRINTPLQISRNWRRMPCRAKIRSRLQDSKKSKRGRLSRLKLNPKGTRLFQMTPKGAHPSQMTLKRIRLLQMSRRRRLTWVWPNIELR